MVALMTKPKKEKHAGGRPPVAVRRIQITGFRGLPKFGEWFKRLVKHCRMPAASVIERGLILVAKEMGFDEPPPDR